ncbi:MAG: Minf_1886 family protein [Planctomycetota bacterium]|nr:Minf_1886 family protein [Planctomycetota bacterium]
MTEKNHPIVELLEQDQRYDFEAYQFVRDALQYAQEIMQMPAEEGATDSHISGQQLCEAIRLHGIEQFGFLSKLVLNSWGVYSTGDFGEIVYNLIRIKHMKKSDSDRREHFDDVYDFSEAFEPVFQYSGGADS